MLIVYIDNIVLSGDDIVKMNQLKKNMGDEFEIKDLENLKFNLHFCSAASDSSQNLALIAYSQLVCIVVKIVFGKILEILFRACFST